MMDNKKMSVWKECGENKENFMTNMMEKIQPEKIDKKDKSMSDEKLKVIQSFIADKKWNRPTLFENLNCCSSSCCSNTCCGRRRCCSNTCRGGCSCCKDEVVLLKNLPDGSITRVETKDNLINRSVKDFYYLQTYLQAKYPEFKWPKIPLHNVLTIADQRHIYKMREDYISDMVRLLQPNIWRHHSEIEKVMQDFIAEDEWKGSKWYSCYRLYIVSFVDSEGHKTGPDLFAFIVFLVGYTLLVPSLLSVEWTNGKYFFCGTIPSALIIVFVIFVKYVSMRPPTLWHTNAKVERSTNRNVHRNIEIEHQN